MLYMSPVSSGLKNSFVSSCSEDLLHVVLALLLAVLLILYIRLGGVLRPTAAAVCTVIPTTVDVDSNDLGMVDVLCSASSAARALFVTVVLSSAAAVAARPGSARPLLRDVDNKDCLLVRPSLPT